MAQVEESGEQNDEATDNAAARTEGYLESLLIDAFKGKGFQNISELLQEGDIEPPQKYSKSLLNQLDKALRQELDRNEFQNVSLLLKCIQLYFKSDLQEETSLFIEQGLVLTDSFNFYLVSWFERAREFVILDSGENKVLMLLLEEFFDSALVICKCSNEGKKELVNLFLPELGHLVTEANVYWALRQEAVRTLNSILDSIPREERKKFPLSEEMCSLTKDLAKTILEVGDYDLQVALSEALCRLMIKKWRDDLVHHWFEDDYLAEAFKEIKDREFETDCRKFLNQLNARIEDGRRVYSLPCISAFADMNEVKKPSDEKLEAFWIDFNTGSQSVSFYVASNEGTLWESVKLLKEAVSNYSLKEFDGENIVKIYMKIPATFNKIEATKIQISFSAEFEILSILRKVLGEEKMMINVAEESVHPGKQVSQNEPVISESTNPQRSKDSSGSNKETLSDNLAAQHSQQLTGTVAKAVNSGVTMTAVSQQTDVEDANQDSANKSKTLSPRMKAKPSEKPTEAPIEKSTPKKGVTQKKRKRKTSMAKQRTEGRKEIYDFENSDSVSHDKVAESKAKILGQKASSQNQRSNEIGNKNEESNNLKRRASNYRKHLFSESNNENTSSGQSEKSWILNSQKQSLPKSLDYTRKRPRVRSKLKVLPASSPSSSGDYQAKKMENGAGIGLLGVPPALVDTGVTPRGTNVALGPCEELALPIQMPAEIPDGSYQQGTSRQRTRKETQSKKIMTDTPSSKGQNLLTGDVADKAHLEEHKGTPPLLDVSSRDDSSDEEVATQKFDVSGKLSREEESLKRKESDTLSSTVIKKPKFSSWETSHRSSDASYKPRELLTSAGKEEEIQTGQEMDDGVDNAFSSKMLREDVSDSGLITAFESFISQLKKLFWTRYKRMETSVQNTLRTSEKNVSTLLDRIHECRMSKLETFHQTVVEELASLEKETQILENMEKDAVDFWNAQLLKLNSFCNQQKQRIQSIDSGLGETAKSFAEAVQNTTYEQPVKKAVENAVLIIPSD